MPFESKVTLLLVAPPQRLLLEGLSSGLFALADYVKRRVPDCAVELVDLSRAARADIEGSLSAFLRASGRVVVGITTTTATYCGALQVARATKRVRPDATVLLGGHHASPED